MRHGAVERETVAGLERELAWATVRTYVQLILLGLVLRWVFAIDTWWLVIGLLVVMVLVATALAAAVHDLEQRYRRRDHPPRRPDDIRTQPNRTGHVEH